MILRFGAAYAGNGKHKQVVQQWPEIRSLECMDWLDPGLFHMKALLLRKLSNSISYMQSRTSEPSSHQRTLSWR